MYGVGLRSKQLHTWSMMLQRCCMSVAWQQAFQVALYGRHGINTPLQLHPAGRHEASYCIMGFESVEPATLSRAVTACKYVGCVPASVSTGCIATHAVDLLYLSSAASRCQLPALADNTPNPSPLCLALSRGPSAVWDSTSGDMGFLAPSVSAAKACACNQRGRLKPMSGMDKQAGD